MFNKVTVYRFAQFVSAFIILGLILGNTGSVVYARQDNAPALEPASTVNPLTGRATTGDLSAQRQVWSQSGWFSVLWGDGLAGATQAVYTLTDEGGQTTLLLMDETVVASLGGALALDRKYVTIQGAKTLNTFAESGQASVEVDSISFADSQAVSAEAPVRGSQPFISIMCKFSDVATEPKNLAYFQGMYASAYPGLDHYWREASYNTANIAGSNAVGWYTLPQPRSYYVYNNTLDFNRAAQDCTAAADGAVNFANFIGINLIFNFELDGYAWGGAYYTTLDGVSKAWSMTWEPPWGYTDITVISHEMGHAFGLPHSSGRYGQTYDNQWDVMSDTWSNCPRSTNATYGCLAQQTNSFHKDLLGWIPAGQKFTAGQNTNATITLEQLALPTNSNYKMAQVSIGGSNTHFYTVEVRRQVGYDSKLPGQAVVIHEVDTTRSRPAQVVDTDGNGNTGDAGAMWVVGETFSDAANNISVTVVSATSTGFQVQIQNGVSAFGKSDPANGAVNQSASATLNWGALNGASNYEYCYDSSNDNACSAWVNNGTSTSASLSGLLPLTIYYWQARGANASGTIYANGSATSFWSFQTSPPPATSGTLDDMTSAWGYGGTWTNSSASSAYAGSYKSTSGVGASATVYFSGVQVRLYYTKNSAMGKLDIYIDDVFATQLNEYNSAAAYQNTWLSPVYADGLHKITFVRNSGKVNVDAIQIIPAPDSIPPAMISDLSAATGASYGQVNVQWTAVGDDGITGTATSYQVRYSTSVIDTLTKWSAATPATSGLPSPASAGTVQTMTVSGLAPGLTYFFAVRAVDDGGNLSPLGNSPSALALAPPPVSAGTYENNNANWILSAGWASAPISGASGGTVHTSSTLNSSAAFVFNGSGFTLRYYIKSGNGSLAVYIDGVLKATLSQTKSTTGTTWKTYSLTLTPGVHVIQLVDSKGKVNFDNIIIAP